MSRRSYSRGNSLGLVLIILFAFYLVAKIVEAIVNFVGQYYLYILATLLIVLIFVLAIIITGHRKTKKEIMSYQETPYYKETNLPYKIVLSNVGVYFEMLVFNQLMTLFPQSISITNLLIPRIGSVNEYSEIDMLFLHETGLYVLELKSYTGYVYGNIMNDYWSVGYDKEGHKTVYEFYNPIKQNQTHVEDLTKHLPKQFENYVIFDSKTDIDSNINNLSHFNEFVEYVKSRPIKYLYQDLVEVRDKVKSINVYEKLDKHIERIQFNEEKYSGYRKAK